MLSRWDGGGSAGWGVSELIDSGAGLGTVIEDGENGL